MTANNRLTRTFPLTFQGLVAVAMLVLCSSVAMAHTGLKTSNPADGTTVNQAPEELHLTFTASVALVRLSVTDAAGKQLALDFEPSTDRSAEYHIPMPAMQMGSLKVEWAAIGEDGHTVTNSFAYTVDPAASASEHHAHGEDHQHSDDHHAANGGDGHAH
ncbi:MAG: copper resistance protein CopC [Gammaproteobacteria bacterium]|nr:copper resistance protein CopC [Gammaproteobacteria bacterium]